MIGAPLHVNRFARAGTQDVYQCDECDPGRVASSVKHRFPREQATTSTPYKPPTSSPSCHTSIECA